MNTSLRRPSPWKILRTAEIMLTGLGLLLVLSCFYAVWVNVASNAAVKGVAVVQALVFVGAAWIVLTRRLHGSVFGSVVIVALLCRLPFVITPPRFSTDVYRYIWDGRVQAAGFNPYRFVPADPALAHLRDSAIYPKINRRDYAPTIYPPTAQAIFLATTRISESVTWMKAVMIGFEVVTVWVVSRLLRAFRMRRERVLLYAWNPLVIWQFAGDGHIDAAAIAFIAVALLAHARRREAIVGIALGAATLVKLYPAVLFPALYRRWGWKLPAALAVTVMAGYLPYASVGAGVLGYLPGYLQEEGLLSGGGFALLSLLRRGGVAIPAPAYIASALVALLVLGYAVSQATERTALADIRQALLMATAWLVLFSPHYPWYFCWVALFLCFARRGPLRLSVVSACALFCATLGFGKVVGISDERLDFKVALYVPLVVLVLADRWRSARTRLVAPPWLPSLRLSRGRTGTAGQRAPARRET